MILKQGDKLMIYTYGSRRHIDKVDMFIIAITEYNGRRFKFNLVATPPVERDGMYGCRIEPEFKCAGYGFKRPKVSDIKHMTNTKDKELRGYYSKREIIVLGSLKYKIFRKLTREDERELFLEAL